MIRRMILRRKTITVSEVMRCVRHDYNRATVRALLWQQVNRGEFEAHLRDGIGAEFTPRQVPT